MPYTETATVTLPPNLQQRVEEITAIAEAVVSQPPDEPTLCDRCGCVIEDDGIDVEPWYGPRETFCDEECARAAGYELCDKCGEWRLRSDGYEINGEWYCDDECAHDAGYESCQWCGEWVKNDDAVAFECRGEYHVYCDEGCANRDGYLRCDRCGEWELEGWSCTVSSGGDEETWCDSCAGNHATCCEGCGNRFDDNDMHYSEPNYCWYCDDCYEEGSEHLHEYGYSPRLTFYGDGGPHLGVELETDGGYNRGGYCDDLHDLDGFPEHFYMTEDGSLDNGVEITSHPMTLPYHVSIAEMYASIGTTAKEHGYKSHDGGRCGLHIHVDRSYFGKSEAVQDAGGYKMMRLLQRFEQPFFIFSRRKDTHWCSYRTSQDYSPKGETVVKILKPDCVCEPPMLEKSKMMQREQSHAQALNFEHRNTFEFRIFRGTLKWSTYFACLGLVDGLCRTVKEHGSIWVESVTWYDLMTEVVMRCGDEYATACLVDYLVEKGLM